MSILGKRLKFLREKYTYSQKRVADAIGISNVQLSRYESGDRNPDPELIAKFADYYEVTTDFLHGRTDNPSGHTDKTINTAFSDFDDITEEEKEYLERQLEIFRDLKNKNRL
ncbi:helix-turn-helix domain-containing protein [Neobacillus sp. M.A.Huq-85]